jgi:hypothetical protein
LVKRRKKEKYILFVFIGVCCFSIYVCYVYLCLFGLFLGSPLQFNFGDAGDSRGIVIYNMKQDKFEVKKKNIKNNGKKSHSKHKI